jgi:ubiquinone/menaquinone biosynthesis C-methylase UbiE
MKSFNILIDRLLFRHQHICPWWLCFTFDNVFRKLFHNPEDILSSYIHNASTALDLGAGMGYFTIPIAQMVGDTGKVIAADLQKEMLQAVIHRAKKAGLENRIMLHLCAADRIGINTSVDFCLAFWMVHEVPDKIRFLNEIFSILEKNGLLLLVEPKIHVGSHSYAETISIARSTGLVMVDQPKIRFSYAALFRKIGS